MYRSLIVLFIFVCLAGCTPAIMSKPDAVAGDFERDKYDCELKLGYVGHAGGMQSTDQLADYIIRGRSETVRCLEMKGWTEQQTEVGGTK